MNKKIIFPLILTLIVMLTSVPLVSAFEFDNIKGDLIIDKDTSEYGKIEIRNSVFGWEWFQLDKVMSLELKENTESCFENGCNASTEIIMYEDGKLIDGIKFIDLKTGKETNIESYEIYVDGDLYDGKEVEGDSDGIKYNLELKGKVYPFQKVDWLIKSAGTDWIDEWAAWSSGLDVGLISYWDFDEAAGDLIDKVDGVNNGTVTGALQNQDGLIGTAYFFNGSTDFVNLTFMPNSTNGTFSIWVNATQSATHGIIGYDDGGFNGDWNLRTQDGAVSKWYADDGSGQGQTDTDDELTYNTWNHFVIQWGTSGMRIYLNGTLQADTDVLVFVPNRTFTIGAEKSDAGFTVPFNGTIDETGYWNRTLSSSEISDLWNGGSGILYETIYAPIVTLNNPVNYYNSTNGTVTFNCSATIIGGYNLTNISLYLNASGTYELNQTNNTLEDSNSTSTIFNAPFDIGSYDWNCYACGNNSNCSFGTSNRTFDIRNLIVNEENYSQSAIEGSTETFYINVTTSELDIDSANLTYNNTDYPATFTQEGYNFSVSRTISIPQIVSSTNMTFNWSFELSDSSTFTSISHNQSVFSLNMDNCSTYTYTLFNISLKDEDDQTELSGSTENTSIKLDFNITTLNRTEVISYSTFFNTTNPAGVCLESPLNQSSLRLDGILEYSSLNRFIEFYHFQNYSLDENTTDINISLYNLNSSKGQEFKITYKDSNFVPVEGAILDIQRKYVDEGVFKTTERPKTGTEGYTMGHLVVNDVIYSILIYKEGEVLAIFNDIVVDCQNPALTSCSINLNSYGSSVLPESFITINDISFTLTYDKNTREVESVFTILSGATSSVNLDVNLFDSLGNTSVCNDTLYASGGTVTCIVPDGFGNSTIVAKLHKNGDIIGQSIIRINPDPSDIYGSNLIFIALIIFGSLIGIGITDNPMTMGITLIIGVIVLSALNIISTPSYVGVGATILWFIVAVILILIKGSNRQ